MVLLVRFGELALKSRYVRRQLRDRLVANIQDLYAAEGVECITGGDEARVYVHTNDMERSRSILGRVFGVVSVSPAIEVHADIDALRDAALAEADRSLVPGKSFALRTRRVGTHPFTSQDLSREIGAAIQRRHRDARVDLSHPDIAIHIEVRLNRGFLFREIWPGPGGLPMGSQGRALAVIHDEAGMVAAWMGMKRGCRVTVAAEDGVHVEPLRRWDVHLKVLPSSAGEGIEELIRLARAGALFVGTRGQDLDSFERPPASVPVFEPVIGLSDDEIAQLAARIRHA